MPAPLDDGNGTEELPIANTWDRMMKMKINAQGRIRLDDLISVKLPIKERKQAFDLCMDRKALKVLMYPHE